MTEALQSLVEELGVCHWHTRRVCPAEPKCGQIWPLVALTDTSSYNVSGCFYFKQVSVLSTKGNGDFLRV